MLIVTVTYIKPHEEADALMPGHVAWLQRHMASGLFLTAGRTVPRTGGVILARSGDLDALRAVVAEDPFAVHGVARHDIVEFAPSRSAAGFETLVGL